jgi:hypothetical protein
MLDSKRQLRTVQARVVRFGFAYTIQLVRCGDELPRN